MTTYTVRDNDGLGIMVFKTYQEAAEYSDKLFAEDGTKTHITESVNDPNDPTKS